jgi:hypothetical protein
VHKKRKTIQKNLRFCAVPAEIEIDGPFCFRVNPRVILHKELHNKRAARWTNTKQLLAMEL